MTLRCAVASWIGAPTAAHGQASVTRVANSVSTSAAMTSDSAAWQRVLGHVVRVLSDDFVRAAIDISRVPWLLTLPATEPQRALLELQLRQLLRARAPVATDTVVRELLLGALRMERDTARVDFRHSTTIRCARGGGSMGFGNHEEIWVPRVARVAWGVARSSRGIHGDHAACPTS
jgi:hypothetical protein